jgi:esterase
MHLALRYPRRVRSLIVVDIAPVTYRSSQAGIATVLASLPLGSIQTRQDADRLLAQQLPNTRLRQFLLQNLVRDGASWRWRFNLPAIQAHLDALRYFPDPPGAQAFTGPSLFLRGETSDYMLDTYLPEIYARFPTAQVQTIPETGHWAHADQPEHFLQAVRDFLNSRR